MDKLYILFLIIHGFEYLFTFLHLITLYNLTLFIYTRVLCFLYKYKFCISTPLKHIQQVFVLKFMAFSISIHLSHVALSVAYSTHCQQGFCRMRIQSKDGSTNSRNIYRLNKLLGLYIIDGYRSTLLSLS